MIEAIERGPVLHKEIQLRMRRFIAEQQLQPGDRLPSEETLCAQLGVGRSALREALKGLEAVGMIESRRGAGNYVAQFDPARYMEYFASSSLVEALTRAGADRGAVAAGSGVGQGCRDAPDR